MAITNQVDTIQAQTIRQLIKRDEKTNRIVDMRFNAAQIKALYNIQNINKYQFAKFVELCTVHNLDPTLNEIYLWESKGRLIIHVGINGWRRVANRHPQYDGIEVFSVFFGDIFEQQPRSTYKLTPGQYHMDPAKLKFSVAIVYRKDRSVGYMAKTLKSSSYKNNSDAWKYHPIQMLEKSAAAKSIRGCIGEDDFIPEDEGYIDDTGSVIDIEVSSDNVGEDNQSDDMVVIPDNASRYITRLTDGHLTPVEVSQLYNKIKPELKGLTIDQHRVKYKLVLDNLVKKYSNEIIDLRAN